MTQEASTLTAIVRGDHSDRPAGGVSSSAPLSPGVAGCCSSIRQDLSLGQLCQRTSNLTRGSGRGRYGWSECSH